MGKKKSGIKVDRGFATTSIPKKRTEEPKVEPSSSEAIGSDGPQHAGLEGATTSAVDSATQPAGGAADAWDDDKAIEQAALQALVDRLHEKGEKEIARIVKAIEYDKRFALSFPKLDINPRIRDRILSLALDDTESQADRKDRSLAPSAGSADHDKVLLRFYVARGVLRELGFQDERIAQCLEGMGEGEGWEEALEWMWLHCAEDECLHQGEYARRSEPDPPLVDVGAQVATSDTEQTASSASKAPPPPTLAIGPDGSLFQAATTLSDSESEDEPDSDAAPDLNLVNDSWAKLMLELDSLRIAAGAAKGKSKKKSNAVVMETPQMVKIKAKMTKLEKEYMFSRKEADITFKAMKARDAVAAVEARLKGVSVTKSTTNDDTDSDKASPEDAANGSDDEGGMFGALLDEPATSAASAAVVAAVDNEPVAVRSMPIPKQFSFTGNLPKSLLRTHLVKSAKHAVMTFARLSTSRAARAGLEIRWSAARRRVWRMDDIACDSMDEAEHYVSTMALHELSASGDLPGVNWRAMPPAYKDLWEELEAARKDKEEDVKRQAWATIKAIVEAKTKHAGSAGASMSTRTTLTTAAPSAEPSRSATPRFSERLQHDYERRRASQAYQTMRTQRDTLPIAPFREQIISILSTSQILVFSGETGCGKSTQLPAFILEHELSHGRPCKIFVTEPRRISAISLAQRVSQELGDSPGQVGTNSSLVGYSIRLESKVSASTRLAFVTNGIALRMLEAGSAGGKGTAFDEVTHIIVDEVHERSIESDFLLIVLKSLLEVRPDLKVVLMSATVDAEKISNYFGGCPTMSVPGRTFPVDVRYLEDAVETAGWYIDEDSSYAVRKRNAKPGKQLEWTEEAAPAEDSDDEDAPAADPTKLSATRYSSQTVSTVNLLDSRQIPYHLIVRLLERLCFEDAGLVPYSPATLVFMPGLAEIRKLNDLLVAHSHFGSADFVVYPLHSTISSEGQSAVFDRPPPGVRKIVISTNIAETGVTIPDITCVIDSGKHREMRYDEKRQISRLVETYISRSNAKQRRGRAGRVQEGIAFHLFTRARHDAQLAEHPIPEMLRLSLQDLALRIKILRVKLGATVEEVLSRAMDPPSAVNIQRAVAALVEVKALTSNEEITPMGRLLSKLPMDVHLGKFLLVAALFRCLDPALTIAATLNSKSPFVTPFGLESQAGAAKRSFAVGNSDFLTIANVFASWRRASDNQNFVRTFCKRNFVSQQNLQQIEELRQQLLAYLVDSGFIEASQAEAHAVSQARFNRGFKTRFVAVPAATNVNSENVQVISSALASGLYPKLLAIEGGNLRNVGNQQTVAIHPSSVNFRLSLSEYGTNYLAYFTLMQSKRLYAWEVGPVDDRAVALLTGDVVDFKLSSGALHIDRKIRYQMTGKTALAIKLLREAVANAMSTRMRGKPLSEKQQAWFDLGLSCLATGIHDNEEVSSIGVV